MARSHYGGLQQTRDILAPGTFGETVQVIKLSDEQLAKVLEGGAWSFEDFTPEKRRAYVESKEYREDLDAALYTGLPYDGCE